MPWLYTVEQGKNKDGSDASDFWFFFKILGMKFSAVNRKVHRNFVLVIKNTYMVSFLLFSSVMHITCEG